MLVEPVALIPADRLGWVHFIAIGGAGMSGVARLYLERGIAVSGSDQADSPALRSLAAAGAVVWVGHDAARLAAAAETVVVSSAIRSDNPELLEARRRGLRVWHRSAALAALLLGCDGVGVSGAHGKTTTSAMCATALAGAGLDPSYVIGAPLAAFSAQTPAAAGQPLVQGRPQRGPAAFSDQASAGAGGRLRPAGRPWPDESLEAASSTVGDGFSSAGSFKGASPAASPEDAGRAGQRGSGAVGGGSAGELAKTVEQRLAGLPPGRSARLGRGRFFVLEADESDGSFLQYPLRLAVVTSVEADHLDNWGTAERYCEGFAAFAGAPGLEAVVCSADDPGAAALAARLKAAGREVLTYGESLDADIRLSSLDTAGFHPSAVIAAPSWPAPGGPGPARPAWTGRLRLQVPGRHNLWDAAAAFAVGWRLGADPAALLAALACFRGAERRFSVVGQAAGVLVVDDYAHHPSELRAVLAAARDVHPAGRVVACFQPHLFSRTRDFAAAFGAALAAADRVVVTDVYPAREDPIPGVTGESAAAAAAACGVQTDYVQDLADVPAFLARLAVPGDLVLTIGAGNVTTVGPALLRLLEGGVP
jgi:UDP-N-acetylmuramate-alanine ligase